MAIEQKIQQSLFPDLPREQRVIDENGVFNPQWSLGFSSLFQALQNNFKDEGIVFPPLNADQMQTIQNLYAPYIGKQYNKLTLALPDISGQTIYDKTTQISNQFIIAQDKTGKVTLAEWVPFTMMLTNAGDPNGVKAGVLNWLCYDITNKVLHICTVAGDISTAVWTTI